MNPSSSKETKEPVMISFLASLLLSPSAQAVPLQITQQGRMIDASGAAVDGSQIVVFRVYDAETGGNQLWEEYLTVQFNNGYYATVLGVDESGNPLDSETLSLYPVFLEIQLNSNPPMSPRQSINSAPYAQIAGVAESVEGGTVNASEVQIGSSPVIDGNRNWVGEPITVDWSSVQNVPSELQDGDNDTQLSESEVENYVTNGGLSLHEDTTLNGQEILTLGNDSDTLANISCSDGDVPKWDGVVGQWNCGFDNDTLADLNCAAGELAKFDGINWSCGEDIDTVLDADTVISYVEQNTLSIPAGSQIDGADILTSADTLEPEWTDIQNRPNGLDDGDDDTQLSQSEVVGYVESSSVNLANGSQVHSRNIVGQPSVCSGGQVLVYNASSNDWECGDDTDTTLTESEMQTMIEAMTLNFQNRPQVSGADVLTTDSTIDPTKIDVSGSSEGQVLTTDGSTPIWRDLISSSCEVKASVPKSNMFSSIPGQTLIDCSGTTFNLLSGSTEQVMNFSLSVSNGCLINKNDELKCWGENGYYQATQQSGTFQDVDTSSKVTCAVDSIGALYCWGDEFAEVIVNYPNYPNQSGFSQISLERAGRSACGIKTDDSIYCWGVGHISQAPSGSYSKIEIGEYDRACALDTNGIISCWGSSWHFGTTSSYTNAPSGAFLDIGADLQIMCGVRTDQTITCWGETGIHDGNTNRTDLYDNIPNGSFSKVDVGRHEACAIDTLGSIQCWGQNNSIVNGAPSNGIWTDIEVTSRWACAKHESNLISCWGDTAEERIYAP